MMCTLVLPILLFSTTLVVMTQAKALCEDSSAVPSKSILTVGKLKISLLVVTEPDDKFNQYIYSMPAESLNKSADELFLNEAPKTVKEEWPELHNNSYYKNLIVDQLIYNSFTAVDSVSEYYFLTTNAEKSSQPGVVYDIKNRKAYKGMVARKKKNTEVLISSDMLDSFYAMQIGDNKGLTVMRYKFAARTVMESLNMTDGIVPEDRGAYYPLCQVDKDSMMMEKKKKESSSFLEGGDGNKTTTCEPLKWPLSKGFVSDDKIYLFGQEKIYIFPSAFYDNPNKPVKVVIKEYSSFINCKSNVVVKTVMGIGIIISIVLVALIIFLCCALFCTREVIHHKRRQHHKKKKREQKKKAAAKAAAAGGKVDEKALAAIEKEKKDTPPPGPMGSILSFFMPTPRSDEESYAADGKLRKNHGSTVSTINNQASVRSNSGVATRPSKLKVNKSSQGSGMHTSVINTGKGGGSKVGGSKVGGSKAGGSKVGDSKAYSSFLVPGASSVGKGGGGGGHKKGGDKKK